MTHFKIPPRADFIRKAFEDHIDKKPLETRKRIMADLCWFMAERFAKDGLDEFLEAYGSRENAERLDFKAVHMFLVVDKKEVIEGKELIASLMAKLFVYLKNETDETVLLEAGDMCYDTLMMMGTNRNVPLVENAYKEFFEDKLGIPL